MSSQTSRNSSPVQQSCEKAYQRTRSTDAQSVAHVATFDFKWTSSSEPGWLARWLRPGDWNGIYIKNSDSKARLVKRVDDGVVTTIATSGSTLSLVQVIGLREKNTAAGRWSPPAAEAQTHPNARSRRNVFIGRRLPNFCI